MNYLRVMRIFSLAAMFALVTGAAFAERSFAQAMVEITAADLTSDTTGAESERKTAQTKVNDKIKAATVTAGTVVTFPSGEFKDVGEIQIFGKSGTAPSTSPAAAAKYITFRGEGTVFTGKIMINVQGSKYVVIEGFTFRDTQAPDVVTVTPGSAVTAGGTDNTATRVEDTGVVWLNTAVAAASAACGATKPLDNIIVRDNAFMNTARHGVLARAKNALGSLAPSGFHARCDSSAVTVSGNSFVGIGLGANADYLDTAKTVPGIYNRESAIEGDETYGWTVTDNVIGVTADGEDARGTTANGIRLDEAFGKTVVSNNTVNNTAWSGIVVGGDGSSGTDDVADADEAEITIANNRVTNSRNNPYIVDFTGGNDTLGRFQAPFSSGYQGNGGFAPGARFFNVPTALVVSGQTQPWFGSSTRETIDDLLETSVCALSSGYTRPYLGPPGACRLLSDIVAYAGNGWQNWNGANNAQDPAPGTDDQIPNTNGRQATFKWLRPGLEAGLELNRITAKTILVENNELTDNVVGLAVCPSRYCYADTPFVSIANVADANNDAISSTSLKVPTVRNNAIYGNRKQTDMPRRFARADVVNALAETGVEAGTGSTGAGKATLVLAGNYLGDSPRVRGDFVNTDDLATAVPDNAGPKETDDPGLAATGGAVLSGTTITLTYDEALDDDSTPAAAAFTVTQTTSGGLSGPITVSGVSVSGMSVTLTLAKAPGSGNSVTVSYDPTDAGSGGPIRDAAGNEAPAFTSRTVTASTPTEPMEPMEPMDPMPMAKTDDGGCALASGGSGGADLGMMLLAMMVVPLAFGLRRRIKEAG